MSSKRLSTLVLSLLVLASLLLAGVPSFAAHFASGVEPDTGFEIEGNLKFDGFDFATYDWASAPYPPAILIQDPHSKSMFEPNIFKPAGKFDYPANWTIQDGSVGAAQAELTNILVWALPPGDLPGFPGKPEDSWLLLGMERTKSEGTFALDFELNQQPWTDPYSGGPTRTPGDIAVGFELQGNPTDPQTDLKVLIVVFDPNGELDNNVCSVTYGNGNKLEAVEKGTDACPAYGATGWYYRFLANAAILAGSDYGAGTMNDEVVLISDGAPAGYVSYDSQGNDDGEIGEFEFAEAAINLSELGLDPGCPGFGSVHAKSRASLEVGSDLKDLAGPAPLPVKCRIDGYKFLDVDADGQWDQPDEPALENWEIQLSDGSVDYTDADGYYEFNNLADGSYTVNEVCPDSSWAQTAPGFTDFAGCGDETYTVDINIDNREVNDLNFGNGQPDIAISKACTADVFVGDDIAYEITVENTGDVDLSNVVVEDSLLGSLGTLGSLPAGDSHTFYESYTAASAGSVYNEASVDADYALATVSDAADCTTTVHELTVTKDANTSFTRTYLWDISKSVNPDQWYLFDGDSAISDYTIAVDKTGFVDSDWAVDGSITIDNPAPMDADLAAVTDMISGGFAATVNCDSLTVPAEDSLTCTYESDLPNANTRLNTATATLNNNNGGTTDFTGNADVIFGDDVSTITEVNAEINVSDDYGTVDPGDDLSFGPFADDDSVSYERSFDCSEVEFVDGQGMYSVTNVATIDETGQSDDATATVNCYQLDVNKDATTFFTRTYEWTIDKSVVPGEWRLFDGETGTSQYTIDIVKTGFTDSDWSVEGEIVIDNPNPARSADLTAVVDNISGVGAATVDCPSLVVAAGGSLTCDYSAPLPDGSDRLNTATATQQNYDFASDGSATADGTTDYSGQADVLFGDPTTEVNKEIDVDDTNGGSWHFAGSGSVSYEMVFDCSDVTFENLYGMYTHDNTAEIVQTGQDSSASVTTHCYQLDVTKDAQTYLTRTYEWTIDKVVDNPGPITVAAGESVVVNYTVTVDVLGFTDSDWAVDGDIDIYNPNPQRAAELTAVLDLISPDIAAGVDCGGETSVPAGGTLTCSYDASLPDAASRTNTATATQQLYDLFYDGTSTPDGTMDYSGQAAVDFASAIVTEVDEQVDVSDSYLGFLGTVHYSEAPKTFEYPRTITAPLDQCGNFQVDNLATFVANDTGATGSDDASVVLYVPCEGCTPGFWQGGYGADLWNTFPDPDWAGADPQPYYHDTLFNDHFTAYGPAAGFTMFDLVSTGGGSDDWQKAARDVVAGTLNASWGMAYPYTPQEIKDMWTAAVNSGDFAGLHATLAPANELGCPIP